MQSLVGSKSSQPSGGQYTETQACDASPPIAAAPPLRTVRIQPLTYRAASPDERTQPIMRCAKSWQTPRRLLSTSTMEVRLVVDPGTYLNSRWIFRMGA